jgi:hypothetical protein
VVREDFRGQAKHVAEQACNASTALCFTSPGNLFQHIAAEGIPKKPGSQLDTSVLVQRDDESQGLAKLVQYLAGLTVEGGASKQSVHTERMVWEG